jgi:hypothetical protein
MSTAFILWIELEDGSPRIVSMHATKQAAENALYEHIDEVIPENRWRPPPAELAEHLKEYGEDVRLLECHDVVPFEEQYG